MHLCLSHISHPKPLHPSTPATKKKRKKKKITRIKWTKSKIKLLSVGMKPCKISILSKYNCCHTLHVHRPCCAVCWETVRQCERLKDKDRSLSHRVVSNSPNQSVTSFPSPNPPPHPSRLTSHQDQWVRYYCYRASYISS